MIEKYLLRAVDALVKYKKVASLNVHYPGKVLPDGSVVVLFDTYSIKREQNNDPWFSFYAVFPKEIFDPTIQQIDIDAKIDSDVSIDDRLTLRIAFRILKAGKNAIEKLSTN
ncbi:MAG: hypothetical protein E7178_04690 [Erysipelotrichaceae bacterium]|nr:hypothetical protein [Erysipelotrichaceae bacterium]